jgi:hypothetical protein
MIMEIVSAFEVGSDIYGKHAEIHDRPAGVDGEVFGRQVRFPWAFVVDPTRTEGRHRATWERLAGVYLQRNGVVHHTGHLDGYRSVLACLRFGEKPLPRLRSAKKLTSRN